MATDQQTVTEPIRYYTSQEAREIERYRNKIITTANRPICWINRFTGGTVYFTNVNEA